MVGFAAGVCPKQTCQRIGYAGIIDIADVVAAEIGCCAWFQVSEFSSA